MKTTQTYFIMAGSNRKFCCFAMSNKYAHGDGKKNKKFHYRDEDCMEDVTLERKTLPN